MTSLHAQPLHLGPHLRVLEDPQHQRSLDAVRASKSWQALAEPHQPIGFGSTASVVWLQLPLHNPSAQAHALMLEIAYARLESLEFHVVDSSGRTSSHVTGSALPFAQRPHRHHFFVLPLTLQPHETSTVYLRVQTRNTMNVPARLWARSAFDAYERLDYVLQASYFGMVLAMAVFNVLLFFTLRDLSYLLYVAFVVSIALTMAAFNGIAFEFLWPHSTGLMPLATYIAPPLAMATLLWFTRRMLSTPTHLPRLDQALRAFAPLNLALPVGLFLSHAHMVRIAYLVFALSVILILVVAMHGVWRRQRSAVVFIVAFAPLCLALLVAQLRGLGLAPGLETTTHYVQIGSALEMLLLAFALADRYNALRREKEQAQLATVQALQSSERDLEARVQARTAELSSALEHLQHTRNDLQQAEKLASLGALVAGVAHELNTPIGNALTTATALQDRMEQLQAALLRGEVRRSVLDGLARDGPEMAALIARSCERAAQLITSFKQVAVDQTSELRRRFDVRQLVMDNVDALRPGLRCAHWSIAIDVAPGITCDSYPGPLGQIVVNLVQNAALHAFRDQRAGTLHIRARRSEPLVILEFEDDGWGMDPNTLAHVFEPFFTTRLGQGGSGLGLSVSHNIATGILGGSLGAVSSPGKGSTFTLTLARVAPGPRLAPPPVPPPNPD